MATTTAKPKGKVPPALIIAVVALGGYLLYREHAAKATTAASSDAGATTGAQAATAASSDAGATTGAQAATTPYSQLYGGGYGPPAVQSTTTTATTTPATELTTSSSPSVAPVYYVPGSETPIPGNLITSSTAPAAYTPPSGETALGSGYYVPGSETPIPDSSGNLYEWISSFAQALPQIAAGQTLYYQPTPGIFQPATANGALIPGLGPSTPLFNLAQSNQAAA